MKQISLIIFLFTLKLTYAQNYKTSKLTGVYSFGTSAEKGPVGQVIVYPESDTTILFYFESCIGPDSYSMGEIYGRVQLNSDTGTYTNYNGLTCKSFFEFKADKLILKADFEKIDCGFGHKVYLNGQFKRTTKKVTDKFTDLDGREINFLVTKPDDYYKK